MKGGHEMLKILLCVKQVPKDNHVRTDPVKKTIIRSSGEAVLNRDDGYALELAVKLKENCGGRITVITMGPAQASDVLKECLSKGADEAVLITDRAFAGSDTAATSAVLAEAVKVLGGADVIICGREASDGNTAQVGPQLADRLGTALISGAVSAQTDEGKIRALRLTEDGEETVQAPLPALLTVRASRRELPMTDLRSVIAASHAEIRELHLSDLPGIDPARTGLAGSMTEVVETYAPEKKREAVMLDGSDPEAAVSELVSQLAGHGLL